MSKNQILIEYAQSYLKKQPFDIIHDFEHHQLVVSNCITIIEQENLKPNTEALLTAAWWHDVEKSYETTNSSDNTVSFFQKTAAELKVDPAYINQCSQIITEHSFNQTQNTLESKILFDADKIEYVNDDRIAKLVDDVISNPGKYEPNYLQANHDVWVARIKKVPDMMHFNYSKQTFLNKLALTETLLEKFQKAINK
jgi:HD superfamily phosphodiesterase